jgi:two-component system, LuxR family, sensor kinase FixL
VQIQQVLLNLVMNACDAMVDLSPQDRRIGISTSLTCDGSVGLLVADCGAGISQGKLEHIFDPFYTTKSHGLRLDPAVCRTIITAHGGYLWAINNPERGATFHLKLPARTGVLGDQRSAKMPFAKAAAR